MRRRDMIEEKEKWKEEKKWRRRKDCEEQGRGGRRREK